MRAFRLRDALLIFYEPLDAELWLVSPQQLLGGATPCHLLDTAESHARVRAVVAQLEDGAHI